jgi:hypothetical protein
MHASAWSNGRGTYGIRVGFPNRDEFFREFWTDIEVESKVWSISSVSRMGSGITALSSGIKVRRSSESGCGGIAHSNGQRATRRRSS